MTSYPFRTQPMRHQKQALRKTIKAGGCQLLTVDAGLGKTKVVIDYAGMLAMAKGRCVLLVVGPLSAVDTWGDEAAKHLPPTVRLVTHIVDGGSGEQKAARIKLAAATLPGVDEGPVLVLVAVNLDVLSSNAKIKGTATVTVRKRMMDAMRLLSPDLGVVDESHRIKGRSSNVSRSMHSLARDIPKRIGLTGTVAPNSPLDFWSQMQWVQPGVLGSWSSFESRHAVKGGWMGKQNVGYRNLKELSEALAPWVFTAKAEDCLDLPPITDATLHVTLSPKERKVYKDLTRKALAELDLDGVTIVAPSAVTRWMKLRQVTSGFVMDSEEGEVHRVGDTKLRACVDKVSDLVATGEKVVVFAHFREDVSETADRLRKRLAESVPVRMIDGSVSNERRREFRKEFLNHDGPVVVVAQMRTVSLAVNEFVAARHAVFLSFSERHDDYIQARARLQRKGQVRAVTLWHIIARNSLDEAILEAYSNKGSMEHAVLQEARRASKELE